MSSSNSSLDPWIGKLVWYFPRDEAGLPIANSAVHGIVIAKDDMDVYIVLSKGDRWCACVHDLELVEEWSEDLEGENSSMEASGERTRGHDRHRTK